MNLNLVLREKVRQFGKRTAIVCGDCHLSYAELDEASNKVAHALLRMGVSKGDRVIILLPDSLEFVFTYFGVVKIGGIAVPLDHRYKIDELASLFDNCQPKVLVTESTHLERLVPILSRFKSIEQVIEVGSKYKGQLPNFEEIVAMSLLARVEVELEPGDIVHIGYTSGPTSNPRGVMLSHECIIAGSGIIADGLGLTEEDVLVLFALPLHHVFGLVIGFLAFLLNRGGRVVILPGLSINTLLGAIERERGTVFMGVPYIFNLLVNVAEEERLSHDLSSLRLCVAGGACLPDEITRRFKRLYGLEIAQLWGLTEATAGVTFGPAEGVRKIGSAGVLLPGWELRIVDDSGRELPVNQPGEIIVRGPIMQGYYKNSQATARVVKDGWLYTGDIGKVDEGGYLFITGRKKAMIIVKGQNVYPSDIEEVLHACPKVAGVRVMGIPDELRGESIRAIVRLKDGEVAGEEEIKRFCRQHLANYKVPRQVVFLGSQPETASGKVDKEDLGVTG